MKVFSGEDSRGVGSFMIVLAALFSISAAVAVYLLLRVSQLLFNFLFIFYLNFLICLDLALEEALESHIHMYGSAFVVPLNFARLIPVVTF